MEKLVDTGRILAGGKGANQAVALARFNVPTSLIAHDSAGDLLLTTLQHIGHLDLSMVRRVKSTITGKAFILVTPQGENAIVLVGGGNMTDWPRELTRAMTQTIQQSDSVMLQREIPDAVNFQVAQCAKKYNRPVFLDIGGVDSHVDPVLWPLIVSDGDRVPVITTRQCPRDIAC